jgi:5-(carboxyamino)imidazole ribonucleotide mutase
MMTAAPKVAILIGSKSDWSVVKLASDQLHAYGVPHESRVLSAHRTPDEVVAYVRDAEKRGVKVFIGAAGGAAHLAGVIAAHTTLPVLAVPITSKLDGLDSLLSMVQMPRGIPVGCLAIGEAGAVTAGILAVQILSTSDPILVQKLKDARKTEAERILKETLS